MRSPKNNGKDIKRSVSKPIEEEEKRLDELKKLMNYSPLPRFNSEEYVLRISGSQTPRTSSKEVLSALSVDAIKRVEVPDRNRLGALERPHIGERRKSAFAKKSNQQNRRLSRIPEEDKSTNIAITKETEKKHLSEEAKSLPEEEEKQAKNFSDIEDDPKGMEEFEEAESVSDSEKGRDRGSHAVPKQRFFDREGLGATKSLWNNARRSATESP